MTRLTITSERIDDVPLLVYWLLLSIFGRRGPAVFASKGAT